MTYKIYKENWYCLSNFDSLESAQAYANTLGDGYNAELSEEQIQETEITKEQKLEQDKLFGKYLIDMFLLDNRELKLTLQESTSILNKFLSVKMLCEVGDIKSVFSIVQSIEIDHIFTQERKDKYTNNIANYLNSR